MKRFLPGICAFIGILFVPSVVFATDAQIACSPTTSTLNVGDTITTDIILNTREFETFGADAIFTYTTGILDTTDASIKAVTDDTKWTSPTKKVVDTALGKVEVDYGQAQASYVGSGTIAQVTFTAKQAGTANINFVHFQEYDDTTTGVTKVWGKKDGTTLSNILTDVVNCVYTVNGAGPTSTPGPTNPPVLPRTGSVENTLFASIGGLVLLGIGFVGLRLIRVK